MHLFRVEIILGRNVIDPVKLNAWMRVTLSSAFSIRLDVCFQASVGRIGCDVACKVTVTTGST